MASAKRRSSPTRMLLVAAAVVIATVLLAGLYKVAHKTSLVPKDIQSSVSFPVYYPDPGKLPAGYTLDTKSFRLAQPGVVIFAVTYGTNNSIVFSEEQPPASSDIDKFVSTYMPVNTTLRLGYGQAKLGATGKAPNIRTLVSLPITNGPWLLIAAPANVNHNDLVKILESLTK